MKNIRFIWICNVGVERFWADKNNIQLPKLDNPKELQILNCYEAMNLWPADSNDILILRNPIDNQYREYIAQLGKKLPDILTPSNTHDQKLSITQHTLADNRLIDKIRDTGLSDNETYIVSYGISEWEEKLAEKCKIRLWGPDTKTVKRLNSKSWSVALNKKLKLPYPQSRVCRTWHDLHEHYKFLSSEMNENEFIALKDVMGVSGSGVMVLKNEKDFQSIVKLLQRRNPELDSFEIILERWLAKKYDFNTQIRVSPTGDIRVEGIKQLYTKKNGGHVGHFFPPDATVLSSEDEKALTDSAILTGKELYKQGYWGVAGIDSLKTVNGMLIPVVEINTRFNMASYLSKIHDLLAPDKRMLAKSYDLLLIRRLPFDRLCKEIIGHESLFTKERGNGILINNFETVNANFTNKKNDQPEKGRLFVVFIEENFNKIMALEEDFQKRLKASSV